MALAKTDAKLAYSWSLPVVVDEAQRFPAATAMTWPDFLEALARLADMLGVPPRSEVEEAVREWYKQARAGNGSAAGEAGDTLAPVPEADAAAADAAAGMDACASPPPDCEELRLLLQTPFHVFYSKVSLRGTWHGMAWRWVRRMGGPGQSCGEVESSMLHVCMCALTFPVALLCIHVPAPRRPASHGTGPIPFLPPPATR